MDSRDKIRVCTLCLKEVTDNYEPITEIVQLSLNFLMVYPNIALGDNPVMCETCAVNLKKCYDFKAKCLSAEDDIASFIKSGGGKVDLRDIYAKLNLDGNVDKISNNHVVCRFCMELVEEVISLKCDTNMFAMLETYFIELDLTITEDIVACTSCYKSLQLNDSFINNYFIVKDRINGLYKSKARNQNHSDTNCAFTFTPDNIKKEEKDGEGMVGTEVEVKLEDPIDMGYRTDSNVYRCDLCDYQCRYKKWMVNHVLTHTTGPRKFKCELCNYEGTRKYCLELHMMTHKGASEVQLYMCATCDYKTKRKCDLKRHMIIHKSVSEIKVYKCELCIFETRHKNCLQQHMLTHRNASEIVMHKCEMCPFKAKRNSDLRRHLLTHKDPSSVTMHKCTKCPFETKSIRRLRNHMLQHSGHSQEGRFKCDQCDYQTRWGNNFNKHVLIHKSPSEVTMYKCETCGYETKHASYMPRHIQMHKRYIEAEVLKCNFCEYETKRKGYLQRHMVTHMSKRESEKVKTKNS